MPRSFFGGVHPKGYKELSREAAIVPLHPSVVSVAMSQHIGAPCVPCVAVGDRVLRGQAVGQVRGFVGLTGDFIAGLFVRASAQSQGIGRALLQRAKAGRSFLRLGVYKKNPRAIAFYQREGFVIESEGLDENTNEPEFTMAWRKPPAAEEAVP